MTAARLWPAHEHHVRRPGWTELFFDLVFAAAISQLSTPLAANYSAPGIAKYAFLLALVFLAWIGFSIFSSQFDVDDVLQRILIIAQIFLVAVMAANATGRLGSRDSVGFAAAFGGVRAILAIQYVRVVHLKETRPMVRQRVFGLILSAIIWLTSAALPSTARYLAWTGAFLIDIGSSWPRSQSTKVLPPGAAHLPERFGLLTIILLGEFVASVMRGIESQMGWSLLPASAAVLSLALGFSMWSSYSDGAKAWETRYVRSSRDVRRLRIWIALHFLFFVAVGVIGVGARKAIALTAGEDLSVIEQRILCSATAALVVVVMGIAATSEHHCRSRRPIVWLGQCVIAVAVLCSIGLTVPPAGLLILLVAACIAQTSLLMANQREEPSNADASL